MASASYANAAAFRGSARKLQLPAIQANNDNYVVEQGDELRDNFFDNDIGTSGDILLDSYRELGSFRGDLRVFDDGEIRYIPEGGFIGTERFRYEACLEDFPSVCDSAIVTIDVEGDPNRPDADPVANNDEYTVTEGETLTVSASDGFLDNDDTGSPSNPLFRCDSSPSKDSVDDGEIEIDDDGSFEYTAPKCFEGDVSFRYKACYEDYKDMESNWATVTIKVEEADRPDEPNADDDTYTVLEATTLTVRSRDGLLDNDSVDDDFDLRVHSFTTPSGFVGELDVDDDGSFTYKSVSGQLGSFEFTYEVCVDGWESCVDCTEATVTIEVLPNPNKPGTPPGTKDENIEALPGDRVRENLLGGVISDDRYTIFASNYQTSLGFIGILNTETDGSIEYGNAPVGNESFVYTVCYEEFPDVCADGLVSISTQWPGGIELRQDVPTLAEVGNDGEPSANFPLSACQADCDDDEDCEGTLVCMHRDATEVVPGCIGTGNSFSGRDFCIQPFEDGGVRDGTIELEVVGDADGEPHPFYPLNECQADCDSDDECSGSLVCFHRSDMEAVPGCVGDQEAFEGRDFCVKP